MIAVFMSQVSKDRQIFDDPCKDSRYKEQAIDAMRAQKDEVKREQSVKGRDACIEHCVIFVIIIGTGKVQKRMRKKSQTERQQTKVNSGGSGKVLSSMHCSKSLNMELDS